jgi:hypothetical protein
MRPASASRAVIRNTRDIVIPTTPKSAGLNHSRSGNSFANLDKYQLDIGTSPKSESSTPLLETKYNRKRAETDLQLLANRIALLKLEEQKALQKVHETKSRAEEILEYETISDFFFLLSLFHFLFSRTLFCP